MPTKEFWSSDGKIHVKVSTIGTNLADTFVEWGAEVSEWKKYSVPGQWWNPFSWGGVEWRPYGSPGVDDIVFHRRDGEPIPQDVLRPTLVERTGYQKISVVYAYIGFASVVGGPGRPSTRNSPVDLGNDARSVADVTIKYTWDGQQRSMSHV